MRFPFYICVYLLCFTIISCGSNTNGNGGDKGVLIYQNLCPSFAGTWLRNDLGSGSDTCEPRQIVPTGTNLDSQNSTYEVSRDQVIVKWNKFGRVLTSNIIDGSETANITCSGDPLYSDTFYVDIDRVTISNGTYSVTGTISSVNRIVHSEEGYNSGAAFLNASYNGNTSCNKSDWAVGGYELDEDFSNCASDDRKHTFQGSAGLTVGSSVYLTFTHKTNGIDIQLSLDPDNLGSPGSFESYSN